MTSQTSNTNSTNTVTLRSLTAFNALQERENVLELFNLVDTTQLDKFKLCYNTEKQETLLKSLKAKVDNLKKEQL
ncbi:high temperature lethal protein 1 [Monosporozyma servazzii]